MSSASHATVESIIPNDNELQKAVIDELSWEPSVTSAHIGVTANDGVVTLTGHVESFVERHAAEMAAHKVKGVKAVSQKIEVRLPFDTKRGDEEIAAAIIERLAWDVAVPRDAVLVNVENGWVTLTGTVDWHYQKESAEQDVRRLIGVTGVSNQIEIKPKSGTDNAVNDIMQALNRTRVLDPRSISVSIQDGKVHLTGSVDSWHARQVASETAWAEPSTTSVENDLSIL